MSDLLAIQDNLLKASAEELLSTDLLHKTTKEQNMHKEYLPDSYVLVHYRTGLPPTRLHTNWKGPMRVIKGFLVIFKSEDTGVLPLKNFYPSQFNFITATIAMMKNINQIRIVYMFKESEIFLHNICG